MKDPWDKPYVYGLYLRQASVAHIAVRQYSLCHPYRDSLTPRMLYQNRTPDPYPVCRNCLRTKRAKELGLLDGVPNLVPRNEDLP